MNKPVHVTRCCGRPAGLGCAAAGAGAALGAARAVRRAAVL